MAADPKVKEALESIQSRIQTFADSDEWKKHLKAQAMFHRYSANNAMWLWVQNPDATRVAGYQTWVKLGRCVKAGETALRILAPIPYPKKVIDKNGNEVEKRALYFKTVPVFDVSQTEVVDEEKAWYPPVMPAIEGEVAEGLYDALVAHALAVGVTKVRSNEDEAVRASTGGFYNIATKAIWIRPGNEATMLSTLIHETAHHLARETEVAKAGYGAEEVIVESIAFIVCDHFGIDMGEATEFYCASWLQADPKGLQKGLNFIQHCAKDMIDALEKALPVQAQVLEMAAA